MTATDTLIEQRASAAPRVTPADLEAAINYAARGLPALAGSGIAASPFFG